MHAVGTQGAHISQLSSLCEPTSVGRITTGFSDKCVELSEDLEGLVSVEYSCIV